MKRDVGKLLKGERPVARELPSMFQAIENGC